MRNALRLGLAAILAATLVCPVTAGDGRLRQPRSIPIAWLAEALAPRSTQVGQGELPLVERRHVVTVLSAAGLYRLFRPVSVQAAEGTALDLLKQFASQDVIIRRRVVGALLALEGFSEYELRAVGVVLFGEGLDDRDAVVREASRQWLEKWGVAARSSDRARAALFSSPIDILLSNAFESGRVKNGAHGYAFTLAYEAGHSRQSAVRKAEILDPESGVFWRRLIALAYGDPDPQKSAYPESVILDRQMMLEQAKSWEQGISGNALVHQPLWQQDARLMLYLSGVTLLMQNTLQVWKPDDLAKFLQAVIAHTEVDPANAPASPGMALRVQAGLLEGLTSPQETVLYAVQRLAVFWAGQRLAPITKHLAPLAAQQVRRFYEQLLTLSFIESRYSDREAQKQHMRRFFGDQTVPAIAVALQRPTMEAGEWRGALKRLETALAQWTPKTTVEAVIEKALPSPKAAQDTRPLLATGVGLSASAERFIHRVEESTKLWREGLEKAGLAPATFREILAFDPPRTESESPWESLAMSVADFLAIAPPLAPGLALEIRNQPNAIEITVRGSWAVNMNEPLFVLSMTRDDYQRDMAVLNLGAFIRDSIYAATGVDMRGRDWIQKRLWPWLANSERGLFTFLVPIPKDAASSEMWRALGCDWVGKNNIMMGRSLAYEFERRPTATAA